MYNPLRNWLLAILKVPPEPHPPAGSPGSLRVFRAGKNYFHLRLFGWGIGQILALAGIIFWVAVLVDVESEARRRRALEPDAVLPLTNETFRKTIESIAREAEAAAKEDAAEADLPSVESSAAATEAAAVVSSGSAEPPVAQPSGEQPKRKKKAVRVAGYAAFKRVLVEFAMRLPDWAFPLIWVVKIAGIVVYLVQIPLTYFLRRLDYELRWYIVTDRSLRLRWGVSKVNETTMSFANLQQVELSQNPIQRLLGLGDVKVQSAGGGSSSKEHKSDHDSMHKAQFHAVENAPEIRDLILERLRRFRQAGLGDPDDPNHGDEAPAGAPPGDALEAARAVLAEARALRAAIR